MFLIIKKRSVMYSIISVITKESMIASNLPLIMEKERSLKKYHNPALLGMKRNLENVYHVSSTARILLII